MKELIVVGMGGFVGAVSRYLVAGWVQNAANSNFPYGTLAVNGIGSFVIGLLTGIFQHAAISPEIRLFVTIGLLGAFTTFSTFSYETMMLFRSGVIVEAFLNIVVSLVVGLLMVYLGYVLGQAV
ncbi:MAG: fluoride efflux transporter CrcB [bacterium]|nr:fluoride efflux transporter CrcB [bacterium]